MTEPKGEVMLLYFPFGLYGFVEEYLHEYLTTYGKWKGPIWHLYLEVWMNFGLTPYEIKAQVIGPRRTRYTDARKRESEYVPWNASEHRSELRRRRRNEQRDQQRQV